METKYCPKCEKDKPLDEFSNRSGNRASQKRAWCKVCEITKHLAYQKANPEKIRTIQRRSDMKRRYDLTLDQIDQIFETQGRKCANPLCPNTEPGGKSKGAAWHADHDHVTGRFRGLLCAGCNRAAGDLNDDVRRLSGLIMYRTTPLFQYSPRYTITLTIPSKVLIIK